MPADYKPHARITASGLIGAEGEQFSYSLSMRDANEDEIDWLGLKDATPDDWDNVCDAVKSFHARASSRIHSLARLKSVKVAFIGDDGRYTDPPFEVACDIPGGWADTALPYQCSVAVTLLTDADLGRVKGRFYLPMPSVGWNATTDLITVGDAELIRDSTVQLINEMSNAPGYDSVDLRVCVPSQGRHNDNGTVRLPKGNHDVQAVKIGRLIDTVRSRRNQLRENYTAAAAVDQV